MLWSFLSVVLEELVMSGRLAGSISGGRQDQAQFVPAIYVRTQNEWVDNFLKQNGYLGTPCLLIVEPNSDSD